MQELSDAFVCATRDSGAIFTKRKDNCAPWINSDLMYEIHAALDSRLPDDWTYESVASIASNLNICDDADDAREQSHEVCDGLVDIYNSARYAWLASNGHNADLCDEAASEFGSNTETSIADRIGQGQFLALTRLCEAVISAVETEAEDRERDSSPEDQDEVRS